MDVGPILGILSVPRPGGSFFGGQNEPFLEILTVAEKMNCTAYVFSPFDIDWTREAVWGYRYNRKTDPPEWELSLYPLPSVIYNRIPNRTMEKREDVMKVLTLLKQKYGKRIFNPCFLDKWQTHQILYNNKQISPFLPATRKLASPADMEKMIQAFGSVYLKPTGNSLGNDIIRITREYDGRYRYTHQSLNLPLREGIAATVTELFDLICGEENREYLIQQAIPLAEIDNRPFDLRLLVQKNRHGNWCRTGLAARIAGKDSISTHVFYGGTRYPAAMALKEAAVSHGFSLKKTNNQIKKIEFLVPRLIEKANGWSFGELEMDLGVDRRGKVWFFEANSKPFRFDEKLIRAKSLVRLLHYVHHLDRCFAADANGQKAARG